MKKFTGFSKIGVIVGILVVVLIGVGAYLVIDGNNNATDYNKYDFYSVIEPTKDNGNIGDHVKGNPDAPVLVFEYADYQCSHCAAMNPYVNKAVEELDGKLGVVYRNFLLTYNKNSTAAASAAEAAGLQGYWKEYMNKLYEEQAEWASATASERTALFEGYFAEVTDGKGDMDKFDKDLASEEVSKKVKFDEGIAKRIGISGTPAFYVEGQFIDRSDAGQVIIDGKTVTWDKMETTDDFIELLKDIVEAKTGDHS